MATSDITYRPADIADVDGILALRELVLPSSEYENREQLRAWWNWQFMENPAGKGIVWVAEKEGRIVGHDAVVPMKMQIDGTTFVVGNSMDTMTHPDYLRRGIFLNLARRVHTAAQVRGMACIILLANNLSRGGFVKYLGGEHVANRPFWMHVAKTGSLCALTEHLSPSTEQWVRSVLAGASTIADRSGRALRARIQVHAEHIKDVEACTGGLWSRLALRSRVATVRDGEYLQWRYCQVPHRTYDFMVAYSSRGCEGYVVCGRRRINGQNVGVIYDIVGSSASVLGELARSVVELNSGDSTVGVTMCRFLAPVSYGVGLAGAGFLPVPLYRDTALCVARIEGGDFGRLVTRSHRWFHQIGDSAWV